MSRVEIIIIGLSSRIRDCNQVILTKDIMISKLLMITGFSLIRIIPANCKKSVKSTLRGLQSILRGICVKGISTPSPPAVKGLYTP
jgi:hypothetical protein